MSLIKNGKKIAGLYNLQVVQGDNENISLQNNVITFTNKSGYITESALTEIETDINTLTNNKAEVGETGNNLSYENNILSLKDKNNNTISTVTINANATADEVTINYNSENELQNVAILTKDGTIKNEWIGTLEEYETAKASGIITATTECRITDDEEIQTVILLEDYYTKAEVDSLIGELLTRIQLLETNYTSLQEQVKEINGESV